MGVSSLALAAAVLGLFPAAGATDCTVHEVGRAALTVNADGRATVAATVGARQLTLRLTLNPHTIFSPDIVDPSAANDEPGGGNFINAGSQSQTRISDLVIGSAKLGAVDAYVATKRIGDGTDGTLGLATLSAYDFEIDLATGTFMLYQHEACPGAGVTWSRQYASVPFTQDATGRPSVSMDIDGTTGLVTFNFAANYSSMPLNIAGPRYGVTSGKPGVTDLGQQMQLGPLRGGVPHPELLPQYEFVLKSASAGELKFTNLITRTMGAVDAPVCDGKPHDYEGRSLVCLSSGDLAIGNDQLRSYHLYFAMKEQKLYFTPTGENSSRLSAPTGDTAAR